MGNELVFSYKVVTFTDEEMTNAVAFLVQLKEFVLNSYR